MLEDAVLLSSPQKAQGAEVCGQGESREKGWSSSGLHS